MPTPTLSPHDLNVLAYELSRWGLRLVGIRPVVGTTSRLPQGATWTADVLRGDDQDLLFFDGLRWQHVPL